MSIVDYSKYTKTELLEAMSNINKDRYSDNYIALLAEFEKRNYSTKNKIKRGYEGPKSIVLGVLALPGYLLCWQLSYYLTNENFSFSMSYDYFVLAWTFSGGERPFFVWFFSIVMFISVFAISQIIAMITKKLNIGSTKKVENIR